MAIMASVPAAKLILVDSKETDTFLPNEPDNFEPFFSFYFPVCVQRVLDASSLRLTWKEFEELETVLNPIFLPEVILEDKIDSSRSVLEVPQEVLRKLAWFRKELILKITLNVKGV